MTEPITVERDGQVLLIGVNRPAKRNAFDLATIEALGSAYDRLGTDEELRAGVLFAHGDHFSAGLDLAEVGPAVAERGPQVLGGAHRFDRHFHDCAEYWTVTEGRARVAVGYSSRFGSAACFACSLATWPGA